MATNPIISQISPPEQVNPPERPLQPLTQHQAIQIARLAIATILLGEPSIETFDSDDLYQSLVILGRMAGGAA
jgi:hypothetical protein